MNKKDLETIEKNPFNLFSYMKEYFAVYVTLSVLACSAIGYYWEYRLLHEFGLNIVAFTNIEDFFLASLKFPLILVLTIFFPIILSYSLYTLTLATSLNSSEAQNLLEYIEKFNIDKKQLESNHNLSREKIDQVRNYYKSLSIFNKCYQILKHPLIYYHLIKFEKIQKGNHELLNKLIKESETLDEILPKVRVAVKFQRWAPILSGLLVGVYIGVIWAFLEVNLKQEVGKITNNPLSKASIKLKDYKNNSELTVENTQIIFITATSKFMFFFKHGTKELKTTVAIPILNIESIEFSEINK